MSASLLLVAIFHRRVCDKVRRVLRHPGGMCDHINENVFLPDVHTVSAATPRQYTTTATQIRVLSKYPEALRQQCWNWWAEHGSVCVALQDKRQQQAPLKGLLYQSRGRFFVRVSKDGACEDLSLKDFLAMQCTAFDLRKWRRLLRTPDFKRPGSKELLTVDEYLSIVTLYAPGHGIPRKSRWLNQH
jgi:hypothetical protein